VATATRVGWQTLVSAQSALTRLCACYKNGGARCPSARSKRADTKKIHHKYAGDTVLCLSPLLKAWKRAGADQPQATDSLARAHACSSAAVPCSEPGARARSRGTLGRAQSSCRAARKRRGLFAAEAAPRIRVRLSAPARSLRPSRRAAACGPIPGALGCVALRAAARTRCVVILLHLCAHANCALFRRKSDCAMLVAHFSSKTRRYA
jgi:hypothetical protein